MADALNTRNGSVVTPIHDLPLNSDVLVFREGNAGHGGKWTGPFKLMSIEGETCKISLPSGPTDFRSTVVKSFLTTENPPDVETSSSTCTEPLSAVEPIADSAPEIDSPLTEDAGNSARPSRARRLPIRYQNSADVSIFLQDHEFVLVSVVNSVFAATPFMESRQKKINGLLEKGVFEIVPISEVPINVRIFGSRFVDEMKNAGTATAYEKSRLVVQAYNDQKKISILTQAPTIQRMSQRLILALPALQHRPHLKLYLRDITQAYVQSTTFLNRKFYVRPPAEIQLPVDSILKVVKPLYGVPEAGAHWFSTYHKHHMQ